MLDARQLTSLQAFAATTLDIAGCLVQRATTVNNEYGHVVETWVTTATVQAGMNEPGRAMQQQFADRIGVLTPWLVSLPFGTDVARGDQLVLAGQTLRVQANLSVGSYSTLAQVLATEVV